MTPDPIQEQFDWTQESAKCVEGLKFDLDQDYNFELVYEDVALHALKTKEGEILLYKKGDRKGQPLKMFTFPFKEVNTNVEFKLEFFQNDSYRVNPENPKLEDDIVRFSRKLGYQPVLDGTFSPADFIKPGIAIKARLCFQKPTKAGEVLNEASGTIDNASGTELRKAYKTIDIDTIVLEGESGASEAQEKIEPIADADKKAVQDMAKGCKKFSELTTKINKSKKYDLLGVAMRMKESKEIALA